MRKVNQKILWKIKQIEDELSELKKYLYLNPDKYEIIALRNEGFSFLGENDHLGNGDFIWIVKDGLVEEDYFIRGIKAAFNKLNPMHYGKVVLYTDFDIEKIPEEFRKLIDVMDIEVIKDIDQDFIDLIRNQYAENSSRK